MRYFSILSGILKINPLACFSAILLWTVSGFAANLHSCPSGAPLDTFRLLVVPSGDGPRLPLTSVNVVQPGEKLRYEPVHLPAALKKSAKVRIVIVPVPGSSSDDVRVLESKPANAVAEWQVPIRASAVGVVFGPGGVSNKKLTSLLEKNPDAVSDAVQFAEQTSKVEALVQALSAYERSGTNTSTSLQSALQGFSSQYGVSLPNLTAKMAADQQAMLLLRAVSPTLSADHSAPTTQALTTQTTGLAANVATMFFGSPFTLAINGVSFVGQLHTALFPSTEFQSAFTEPSEADGLNLCAGTKETKKPHTRTAYLWMLHIPDVDPPKLSITAAPYLPTGWTSSVKITCANAEQLKFLARARDWRLVSADGETPVPAKVVVGDANDQLTIDLRQAKVTPGEYHLTAKWDWSQVPVEGTIQLKPFSDLSLVRPTSESQDNVISGNSAVALELTGTDFEFVEQVSLSGGKPKPVSMQIPFTLPKGPAAGVQQTMATTIDATSLAPGPYHLIFKQLNGSMHTVALTVHPPNPTLDKLPIRINLGESKQAIELHGTGLERVDRITSDDAVWTLSPVSPGNHDATVRQATVSLSSKVKEGDHIGATMFISGMNAAVPVADVLDVAGPRPKVIGLTKSIGGNTGIELHEGELASGIGTSFSLQAEHIGSSPTLNLECRNNSETVRKLTLQPGQKDGSVELDITGDKTLFLSFDPGSVGQSGCMLVATITNPLTGSSDPYPLGRILHFPKIDKFELTNEKTGSNLYAGTLEGQGLQAIEKTGWGPKQASAVPGIPTPVPGNPSEQKLRINMIWPPPAPHAVLYIWLQGDNEARATDARY